MVCSSICAPILCQHCVFLYACTLFSGQEPPASLFPWRTLHPLKLIRKHAAVISCRDTRAVLIRLFTDDSNTCSSISIHVNPHVCTIKILNLSCELPELQFCTCELSTNNPLLDPLHKPLNITQCKIYWISKQSVVQHSLFVASWCHLVTIFSWWC